jgi:ketosteroid isomerase-like protein
LGAAETHPNAQLIERFYRAFDAGDGETMAASYAPHARFSDPVFPDLSGARAGEMWKMFCAGREESGLRVELLEHEADDAQGSARWRARYTFVDTGRPVENDIRASFRFEDGLIAEHRDEFDFYRWARQALGPVGLLLGWTPMLRSTVRRRAAARLERTAET